MSSSALLPEALRAELDALRKRADQFSTSEKTIEELRRHLDSYERSTFWRLTWPARMAVSQGRRLLGFAGRFGRDPVTAHVGTTSPPRITEVISCAESDEVPDTATSDEAPLRFPRYAHPVLSIIIPVYGQVPVTLRCLRSIMQNPPSCSYEVLVAEDASGDPAVAALAAIPGLVFIGRQDNLGFLRNSNDAARMAGGTYFHFLNNDTEVLPGAFDALVTRLESDRTIGLTGSKLLFADGTLQEAGGIVWNDASGMNVGRGDRELDRAAWNWPRDVDYISGASIAISRALFDSLNGFDEIFAPAYYEDTDLAFRVRAAGFRVVFEPASVVIHHEGISHGTDETRGVKACQARNRDVMLRRWKTVLEADHFAPGTHLLRAAAHGRHRQTILIIDHYVPQPDRDAGSRATLCVIRALLGAGWLVKFWPMDRKRTAWSHDLECLGVEICDHTCPLSFSEWLEQNGDDLDHVMIMRPVVAREFLPLVVAGTAARRSYYGHDIHFLRMMREAEVTGNEALRHEALAMQRLEMWLWQQFECVIYLSDYEARLVRDLVPAAPARTIVPFCFTPDNTSRPVTGGATILFVGGFAHPPNVDAALWLHNTIMPLVRARAPQARLVLAGSGPAPAVCALADSQTTVTGAISDEELERLYATARVAAVPLRFGAGVKNKVLEALHHGLPLVTTPVGAEGVTGISPACGIADTAEAFADALVELIDDDGLWRERSDQGRRLISEEFSPVRFSESLLRVLTA
ncbi:glycosyltransferase [Acetobacter fallax]|uniref:Glycosyltransferase n=1 Tax=Acetobacter fallax TaxID=1737473 RepID=A0ABX0KAC3_9PROT|nr:glycosyltransferase [Acetobacter fallax]NHO32369.1 glycosyltransferase [Acetobacter fallax]NHO35963.1 glycosyltransferase [Acetobacter fallax]